jgi:hypothetical protein
VIGFDAGAQEVDVTLDEDAGFPGAGGRFEHDVLCRIDGGVPGRTIGKVRPFGGLRAVPSNVEGRLKPDTTDVGSGDYYGVRLSASAQGFGETRRSALRARRR